jgi:hypothetical protein
MKNVQVNISGENIKMKLLFEGTPSKEDVIAGIEKKRTDKKDFLIQEIMSVEDWPIIEGALVGANRLTQSGLGVRFLT